LTWNIPYQAGEINLGDVVLVIHDADKPGKNEIDRFDARQGDRLLLLAVTST
jgi:hypothetical protein